MCVVLFVTFAVSGEFFTLDRRQSEMPSRYETCLLDAKRELTLFAQYFTYYDYVRTHIHDYCILYRMCFAKISNRSEAVRPKQREGPKILIPDCVNSSFLCVLIASQSASVFTLNALSPKPSSARLNVEN